MPRYVCLLRPPMFASLPRDLKWDFAEIPARLAFARPDLPTSKHLHGVIETKRALTPEECERFDLEPVATPSTRAWSLIVICPVSKKRCDDASCGGSCAAEREA
jgi:hypothetical protein